MRFYENRYASSAGINLQFPTGDLSEAQMSPPMITCPNTGQPISTGIETDEYSLKQIADVPARTRCPLCGLDHIWWKREAWLANRPGQPPLKCSESPVAALSEKEGYEPRRVMNGSAGGPSRIARP